MRKLLWALAAALALAGGSLAVAQPTFFWNHPAAAPLTGNEIIGPVRQGFGDVTLTLTTIKNWVLANLTLSGGVRVTGDQSLAVTPQGSPLASRSSFWATGTSVAGTQQNFFFGKEFLSQSASSSLGGNITDYSFIRGVGGSGGVWSGNDVVQLDASFPSAASSAIGREIDINNLAVARADFNVANNVGLLINGLGNMNTAAVSVQTGSGGPIWYHGLYFGDNAVSQFTIRDKTNSSTSIQIEGQHAGVGLDLAAASFGGAGIRIGGGIANGIAGRAGNGTTYGLFYMDSQGFAHIGSAATSNAYSDGHFNPGVIDAFNLGALGARWAHVYADVLDVPAGNTRGLTVTRPNLPTVTLLYGDTDGAAHLGSVSVGNAFVDGNLLPVGNAAYALGASAARFTNAWVGNLNGVPVPAVSTPASSSAACAAGQIAMDASFAYFCVGTNSWRRAALSTF